MKILQILVLVLFISALVFGQNKIKLSGVVTDENKGIIPNTVIMATNQKGDRFKTVSDQEGFYELLLPDGIYRFEADTQNPGFEKILIEQFKITIDRAFENELAYKKFDIVIKVDKDFTEKYGTSLTSDTNTVLTGTIYDQQGAVIPNVEIYLKNEKGKEYKVKTNNEGIYIIKIPAGVYDVEFQHNFFKSYKVKKYLISPSYKGKVFFDVSLVGKQVSG